MTDQAYKKQGLIYVPSPMKSEKGERAKKAFLRIEGCVAWGDSSSDDESENEHAVVIAGEDESHRIIAFRQFRGQWGEFLDKLIEFKDNYLVSYYHIPPSSRKVTLGSGNLMSPGEPLGLREQLYDLDGLSEYKKRGRNRWGQPIYVVTEPKEKWATFRSYDTTAVLCDLQDRFLVDFEAARLFVTKLIANREVGGDQKMMAPVEKASYQRPADMIKQTVIRALIGAIWTMWETSEARRPKGAVEDVPQFPWSEGY